MITTRMSGTEVLKEYWKDYEVIRERIYSYLNNNIKKLTKLQKQKEGDWVLLKDPKHIKTNRHNDYYSIVEARIHPKVKKPEFTATTFTTILDSDTGKQVTLLFPAHESCKAYIIFEPKAISSTNLDTLNFIKLIGDIDIRCCSYGNEHLDFYAYLAEGWISLGKYNEKNNCYVFKKTIQSPLFDQWKKELNMDTDSLLEVYFKHCEVSETEQNQVTLEIPQELTRDQEIELAWKEYLGR